MTALPLLAFLIPLAVGVVALAVVLLVVVGSKSPAAPTPTGPWQAELLGSGLLDRTYGVLTLHAGHLSFFRNGAAEPDWTIPCPHLWVRRQGVGPFAVAAVVLRGPMGEVALNVSQEHINRFSQNTMKTFRQSGYADRFVATLLAHGARPA